MKFKKTIFTAMIAVCASTAARAQDWKGFYIGLNAGHAWVDSGVYTDPAPWGFPAEIHHVKSNGSAGGATLGYNWQFGHGLFGFEADYTPLNLADTRTTQGSISSPIHFNFPYTLAQGVEVSNLASLRMRAGWASPRWLIYATAGGAAARIKSSEFYSEPDPYFPITETVSSSQSRSRIGFAWGGGAEIRLTRRWSIKGEWLHAAIGGMAWRGGTRTIIDNNVVTFTGPSQWLHSVDPRVEIARIGVNFRF